MDCHLFNQLENKGVSVFYGHSEELVTDCLRLDQNYPTTFSELELFKQNTISFFKMMRFLSTKNTKR